MDSLELMVDVRCDCAFGFDGPPLPAADLGLAQPYVRRRPHVLLTPNRSGRSMVTKNKSNSNTTEFRRHHYKHTSKSLRQKRS